MEKVHLEDREVDGRIALNFILGRYVVRMRSELNLLRIMFIGGLWY